VIRDAPPDDGSRQVVIITDEEGAEMYEAALERWRRRCPGLKLTDGDIFKNILINDRIHCEDDDDDDYTIGPDTVELGDDGGMDGWDAGEEIE
jgi:hypothetical protein